ncbi:MAG: TonB-dependent receptor [Deltaproteobacteria bacterium]|nr:TonB-dependent receptor [Deltaproteobacteria bacterium]
MNPFLIRLYLPAALILILSSFQGALAQSKLASLYSSQGEVEGRVAPSADFRSIDVGQELSRGDVIKTLAKSRAGVLFSDGFLVRLSEESFLELKERQGGETQQPVSISQGVAYFFSREPRNFPRVDTPVVSAAVRGTEFVVRVSAAETIISVLSGRVEASNQYGKVLLTDGEEAVTTFGNPPVKRIMVQPLDAVQWALYYPALLEIADLESGLGTLRSPLSDALALVKAGRFGEALNVLPPPQSDWRAALLRGVALFKTGNSTGSLAALGASPQRTCEILLFMSEVNLAAGDVAELQGLLTQVDQCLQGNPSAGIESAAAAQRAILELTRNDKVAAHSSSSRALELKPDSLSALLVRSYVAQSAFELEEARVYLERARALAPRHPIVLARLAELELSFGDLDKAEELISSAYESSPDNFQVLTVMGFVKLSSYEPDEAIQFFNRASTADPAAGLPYLGAGLALIRKGILADGRQSLEKAVLLEPQVSIYRSYLGKAFFEEEREGLAAAEYAKAISLDPRDPTPYLYRSTLNLARFMPVEALEDIEDSIRLNDNRAIYRSTLLLDQDLAVRGSNLAETFIKLGFQEAARLEAIKSLNRNYSNFSAHYLLAGSYANSPLFGEAFITENLVGSLLAPVNFNTILPNFAGDAALNEYTALFDRPTHRTRIDGVLVSEIDTAIGEVSDLGAAGGFAYAATYQGSTQNGPFDNDKRRQHLASLNTQFQLTPEDSIKLFNGLAFSQGGDISTPFDSTMIDRDFSEDLDLFVSRAGYHHQFSQQSHFLFQYSYGNQHVHTTDGLEDRQNIANLISQGEVIDSFDFIQTINEDYRQRFRGSRFSGQYILDRELFSLVLGGDALNSTAKQNEDSTGVLEEVVFPVFSRSKHAEDSQTYYLYPTLHVGEIMDISLGVSYSEVALSRNSSEPPFITGSEHSSVWAPKAGLSFYLSPKTTLRAAYFETSGVAGPLDRESLEPTLIGGFNQIFDDILGGTRTRNYAVGIDHKLPKSTYIGSEFINRAVKEDFRYITTTFSVDIDVPEDTEVEFERELLPGADDLHASENLVRSYIYQVVASGITATLDHTYSEFEDNLFDIISQTAAADEIRTHRVKLGLNFVDPSGFVTFGGATWRQQGHTGFGPPIDGERDFWIVDWGFAYLLPHRRGSIVLNFGNVLDQDFKYSPTQLEASLIPSFNVGLGASLNF